MAGGVAEARCTNHGDAAAEGNCARCGDFVCRLCGPLEPVALCPRCAIKTTLDWEERGDYSPFRAFWLTAREAVGSPTRMGSRVGGAGHAFSALLYVTVCALLGLVPLSLILSVPLLTLAKPYEFGLRSTGALSVAVSLVLFSVAGATLLSLLWSGVAFAIWGAARIAGISIRYDVLLRAGGYGLSLLGVPLVGPLLTPIALVQALLAAHAALCARSQPARATLALSLVAVSVGLCGAIVAALI